MTSQVFDNQLVDFRVPQFTLLRSLNTEPNLKKKIPFKSEILGDPISTTHVKQVFEDGVKSLHADPQ